MGIKVRGGLVAEEVTQTSARNERRLVARTTPEEPRVKAMMGSHAWGSRTLDQGLPCRITFQPLNKEPFGWDGLIRGETPRGAMGEGSRPRRCQQGHA
jgi:hypothetical protein